MTAPSPSVERLVEAWCARDRAHAFVKTDLEIIEATAAARAFAAERLLSSAPPPGAEAGTDEEAIAEVDRDLLHAFGALGRIVGADGGSPTLASAIVDGARCALEEIDLRAIRLPGVEAPWIAPARAALMEAFATARHEAIRAEAATRWEYPSCAVGLYDESVAIAAGYPEDDADALAAWASRVAQEAALAGVRRAVVSGSRAAQAALADALAVVGIEWHAAGAIGGDRGRGRRSS